MVLQHANRIPHVPAFRLDTARIAAGAGAIALNVLVLMLLLVPATAPTLRFDAPGKPGMVWVDLTPKPPIPKAPPVVVPVRPHVPTPVQTRTIAPTPVTVPQPAVVFDDATLPATPSSAAATDETAMTTIAPSAGPIAGVQLEYATAPPPTYPTSELRNGTQGTVLLRILVDIDGHPLQVDIARSSGNRNLDEAARRTVQKRWMFKPAMRDGRAVQAIGMVPIAFNLQ